VLTRGALLASADASAANLGWQDDECWLLAMPLARVGGPSMAEYLAERLAPHKQPRRIGVVASLPLSAAGKLDRAALEALTPILRVLPRRR
jgi:non-ribosomal peptide synthetase component E (peptide arylation enzyme)